MTDPHPLKKAALAAWIGVGLAGAGCGSPSRANTELRKENQQLQSELTRLRQQHEADQRTVAGLRDRSGSVPTLPATRLAQLFTTAGIEFGRLTGGADLDPNKPGDEGLAVYIVPVDQTGDRLKAAGSFDIDAFDLDDPQHPLVGHWHIDVEHARAAWTDIMLEYGYVFTLPWQERIPRHPNLTVKATFLDELTQTPFTAQRVVKIKVPSSPEKS